MKKMIFAVAVALIFGIGAFAYAHGPGYDGPGGGHMMGQGYGGHMMAREGVMSEDNKKFLDETRELRKELHNKRFEYMELSRNSDTSDDTMMKLEKEIFGLEDRIREKAPRTAMGGAGNNGLCW